MSPTLQIWVPQTTVASPIGRNLWWEKDFIQRKLELRKRMSVLRDWTDPIVRKGRTNWISKMYKPKMRQQRKVKMDYVENKVLFVLTQTFQTILKVGVLFNVFQLSSFLLFRCKVLEFWNDLCV